MVSISEQYRPFYDNFTVLGKKLAFITESGSLSYEQLQFKINECKKHIVARSLVFCICSNTLPAMIGYLACLQANAVPVMIHDKIDKIQYQQLFTIYQPQFVWAPRGFVNQGIQVFTYEEYDMFDTCIENKWNMHPDLALLLTTSGSTGSRKLVRQSYKNINSNVVAIADYLKITSKDRPITTLPMNYTYGLSILHTHLFKGATVILNDYAVITRNFWKLLKEMQATTFGGVPYTYETLKRLHFLEMDLPSIRYLTQAGGKLRKDLTLEFAKGCQKKGIDFVVMYGQTEATARMSYVPADQSINKAGSIGIPIPKGTFTLIDEWEQEIQSVDTIGELMYCGPNVAMGYAEKREDLMTGDIWNGKLLTGDMAYRDRDGYYYIAGRKKRFLKMFGNRISLDELEALLMQKGYECACVGEDDHMWIFTICEESNKIKTELAEILKIHHSAFTVKTIAQIPRGESGKILYGNLEEHGNELR